MAPDDNRAKGEFDPYALVNPYDEQAKAKRRYAKQAWRGRQKASAGFPVFEADPRADTAPVALTSVVSTSVSERDEDFEIWARRNAVRRRLILAMIVVLALLVIGGAGSLILYESLRTADISAYAQTGISISGLEEEDFIVTLQELGALEIVDMSTTGTGRGEGGESKAGAVNAHGPTLESFLATYGYTIADFRSIRFVCKDGYTTALRPSRMEDETVIMSFASGKEPLAPYQQPLRLVIPDGNTGQWCFGILRIEFTPEDAVSSDREILGEGLFLDDPGEQRNWEDTP
jgi:hypothetical protein